MNNTFDRNDQVTVSFVSGEQVVAEVLGLQGDQFELVALSYGGGLKHGDIFFDDGSNMIKISKKYGSLMSYGLAVLGARTDVLKEQFIKRYVAQRKEHYHDVFVNDHNTHDTGSTLTPEEVDAEYEKLWKEKYEVNALSNAGQHFEELSNIDSTPNKQYLGWILRLFFTPNRIPLDDYGMVNMYLQELYTLKLKGKAKGIDIGQIKSVPDLYDAIKEDANVGNVGFYGLAKTGAEQKILETQATVLSDTGNYLIVSPDTYEASCLLGRGAWCTSYSQSDRNYKNYTAKGKLYCMFNKNDLNEKYQYYPAGQELADRSNRHIRLDRLPEELKESLFNLVSGDSKFSDVNGYVDMMTAFGKDIDDAKMKQLLSQSVTVDEEGVKEYKDLSSEVVDYITNKPDLMDVGVANNLIYTLEYNEEALTADQIEGLLDNYKIEEDSWDWMFNNNIDFPESHYKFYLALKNKGLLDSEDIQKLWEKRRSILIPLIGANILGDEVFNSIVESGHGIRLINGQTYVVINDWIDLINLFDSDDQYGVKWVLDDNIDYNEYTPQLSDCFDDLNPETIANIRWYVADQIKKGEIDEEDIVDYGEWETNDSVLEDLIDNHFDDLSSAICDASSRAGEVASGDARYQAIMNAIEREFGEPIHKDNKIYLPHDLTDSDYMWSIVEGSDYDTGVGIVQGLMEYGHREMRCDLDRVYGNGGSDYVDGEFNDFTSDNVSGWNEAMQEKKKLEEEAKKKEVKKVVKKKPTTKKKKKTALKYDHGDEASLFDKPNKGVIFVGGDLMGTNVAGEREPYSINWLQANGAWAVRQMSGATNLKNQAMKGFDVIAFVAYKTLTGGMESNNAFKAGVQRAIDDKLNQMGLTLEQVKEEVAKPGLPDSVIMNRVKKYLGVNHDAIAKELAMDEHMDYLGKIVGVAKFAGIRSHDDRGDLAHEEYPVNVILENYTDINPPLDFEEFMVENGVAGLKDLWLKLRSFALTVNVQDNPAVSYLYDVATYHDVMNKTAKNTANNQRLLRVPDHQAGEEMEREKTDITNEDELTTYPKSEDVRE